MEAKFASALAAVLAAGFLFGVSPGTAAPEKAVAPEHNPPGDIPDTQVFVAYASSLGFTIKVPEGWSRKEEAQAVSFADKYNTIIVSLASANTKPTADSVKSAEVPELEKTGRAVKVTKISDVKSGPAVLISYTANSEPNAVTKKRIRLEHDRYLFYKDGKLAVLDMAAPQGADNVDDWSMMANSFHWK
jgi:hypothetical protein